MKKVFLSILAGSALLVTSCGGGNEAEETTTETTEVAEAMTYTADVAASTVNWRGDVIGVYGHEGTINLSRGSVMVAGDQIVGGEFVIDMNTITPTDSGYTEESPAEKLVAHLGTDDFFSVAEFPTASFNIKSVNGKQVVGDLTVKGQTHEETLDVETMELTAEGMTMSGKLVFDRQKYGVSWKHYVKDYVLSDDIVIKFAVVAKP